MAQQVGNKRLGLYALLTADVFSTFGSRFSLVAIPWLVLISTGSAAKMGLVAASEMIPYLLTSVLAAPIADRFGMRRTSVCCDLGSAVAMGLVAAIGHLGFVQLCLLIGVSGALRGVSDRTKHVLLRPTTAESGIPMLRVTSAYEAMNRSSGLLGGPLAGVLVATIGPHHTIWLDAGTYAVAALLVGLLVNPAPEAEVATPVKEPYWRSLRGGFAFLKSDRILLAMLGMLFMVNFFQYANGVVLLPLWVKEEFGSATGLGWIMGVFAAGSLLGNVLFTVFATKIPQMLSFFIGAAIGGAPKILVLGLTGNLTVVLIVTFFAGLGMAGVNPVVGAVLYERIPAELQTRVFGVVGAVAVAGIPLGSALTGASVAGIGLRPTIMISALVLLAATVIPLAKHLRGLQKKKIPVTQGEPG